MGRKSGPAQGFTLIELLVVMLIIGVLASVGVPRYFRAVERGRISEGITFAKTTIEAMTRYCIKTGLVANDFANQLDVEFNSRFWNTPPTLGGTDCGLYDVTVARNATQCSKLGVYSDCPPPVTATIKIDQSGAITFGAGIKDYLQL